MRMSCNSTYLLDRETDSATRPTNWSALLDEFSRAPKPKRSSSASGPGPTTSSSVASRHAAYPTSSSTVASHPKTPGHNRAFRSDPTCLVSSSTEPAAPDSISNMPSTLINMDLPWNPAVLEQRIGAHPSHRADSGQCGSSISSQGHHRRGHALRAGVQALVCHQEFSTGAGGEISFGGSRLSRFMKEVENVTVNMGESQPITPVEEKAGNILAAADAAPSEDATADANIGAARGPTEAAHLRVRVRIRGKHWCRLVRSSSPLSRPPTTPFCGSSVDRMRPRLRRAGHRISAARAGNRKRACRRACGACGQFAGQDRIAGGRIDACKAEIEGGPVMARKNPHIGSRLESRAGRSRYPRGRHCSRSQDRHRAPACQ